MDKREKEVLSVKEMATALLLLYNVADEKEKIKFIKIHLNGQNDTHGVEVSLHETDKYSEEIGEQKTELILFVPQVVLTDFINVYESTREKTIYHGLNKYHIYSLSKFIGKYASLYYQ